LASKDSSPSGIAERYATALYDLAAEDGSLDAVAADLKALAALIDGNADLTRLVRSPIFTRDEQGAALGAVLDKMGVSPLTRKFVLFVASQRRAFALVAMARAYQTRIAKARGEMTATVTSAFALKEHQIAGVKAALKAAYGRDVALETRVDPALIGGMIVQAGSRMVDSSIRTKLVNLSNAMKGA